MRVLILLALAVLVPCVASADTKASKQNGSNVWTMCDQETGDGVDCTTGGDEIVLNTEGLRSIVVDFSLSTATTLDCDVVGNNEGHDAASGVGETMNTTAFSTTLLSDVFTDPPKFVWVHCTTTTGGYAHATILGRR